MGSGYAPADRHAPFVPAQDVEFASTDRQLRAWFGAYFFVLIFLQKFAITVGGLQVSVIVPAMYILLAVLAVRPGLGVSLVRLTLFVTFVVASAVAQVAPLLPTSLASYLMLLVLYAPMVVMLPIGRAQFTNILDMFQRFMVVGAVMVGVQVVLQVALRTNISMDSLVPQSVLLQGYIYSAPLIWGEFYARPNGFFFLETSFAAMFLATALIIELAYFRRAWRAATFAIALVATLGVTGFVMMAVAIPLLLGRLPRRVSILLVGVAVLGVVGIAATGAADVLLRRLSELGQPGSSGYGRLVQPAMQLLQAAADPHLIVTGYGAGNAPTGLSNAWPMTKLAFEYGFLTMLLLIALVFVAALPSRIVALSAALLVVYNFVGGYLHNPALVGLMLALCTLTPRQQGDRAVATPIPQVR